MDPEDNLKPPVVTYSVRWSPSPGSCPLLNCREWAKPMREIESIHRLYKKVPPAFKNAHAISTCQMCQRHLFVFEGFWEYLNSPRSWFPQIQDLKLKEGCFFSSANQEGAHLAEYILWAQPWTRCSTLVISHLQTSLWWRWTISILQSRKLRHTGVNQLSKGN